MGEHTWGLPPGHRLKDLALLSGTQRARLPKGNLVVEAGKATPGGGQTCPKGHGLPRQVTLMELWCVRTVSLC